MHVYVDQLYFCKGILKIAPKSTYKLQRFRNKASTKPNSQNCPKSTYSVLEIRRQYITIIIQRL